MLLLFDIVEQYAMVKTFAGVRPSKISGSGSDQDQNRHVTFSEKIEDNLTTK